MLFPDQSANWLHDQFSNVIATETSIFLVCGQWLNIPLEKKSLMTSSLLCTLVSKYFLIVIFNNIAKLIDYQLLTNTWIRSDKTHYKCFVFQSYSPANTSNIIGHWGIFFWRWWVRYFLLLLAHKSQLIHLFWLRVDISKRWWGKKSGFYDNEVANQLICLPVTSFYIVIILWASTWGNVTTSFFLY